jgi:hypothetical protein
LVLLTSVHHAALLRVVDEQGDTMIPPMTAEVELPQPANYEGDFAYWPIVLVVNNATFPDFGKYIFEMRIDEAIVAEAPIYVRQLPQTPSVP